ncbi:MAG: phosphatase PAP2 family protein [Candidatus Dojkabacteria bacterium]
MINELDNFVFEKTEFLRKSKIRNLILIFSINPKITYIFFLFINFVFLNNTILLNIVVFFIADIFIFILKRIIKRTRPVEPSKSHLKRLTGLGPDQYSFPSAHTFTAFQILPLCFNLNFYLGIVVTCYAFLVALSRITLKHHYASDVLFSICLGIIVGTLNITII